MKRSTKKFIVVLQNFYDIGLQSCSFFHCKGDDLKVKKTMVKIPTFFRNHTPEPSFGNGLSYFERKDNSYNNFEFFIVN